MRSPISIFYFTNRIPTRKSFDPAALVETHTNANWVCTGWEDNILCVCWTFAILPRTGAESWRNEGHLEDSGGGKISKPAATSLTIHLTSLGQVVASSALFNHAGDGIVASFHSEHTLRVFDYPGLTIQENPAAHVGGCVAIAQDPRGKYIASGGHDSIVNLFDVTEWICARTITCCE